MTERRRRSARRAERKTFSDLRYVAMTFFSKNSQKKTRKQPKGA
jgi:hypothetical protein